MDATPVEDWHAHRGGGLEHSGTLIRIGALKSVVAVDRRRGKMLCSCCFAGFFRRMQPCLGSPQILTLRPGAVYSLFDGRRVRRESLQFFRNDQVDTQWQPDEARKSVLQLL